MLFPFAEAYSCSACLLRGPFGIKENARAGKALAREE